MTVLLRSLLAAGVAALLAGRGPAGSESSADADGSLRRFSTQALGGGSTGPAEAFGTSPVAREP